MFSKIGIVGLGLIGGSLAKAFRNRTSVKTIVAFNRHEDVLLEAKSNVLLMNMLQKLQIYLNIVILFLFVHLFKTLWNMQKS